MPLAAYYAVGHVALGQERPPCLGDRRQYPGDPVGDPKYNVPLRGTVTVDDKGTPCDADDTLAADIAYGAATRNFAGGPGTRGEETWGDGDLGFELAQRRWILPR